jgi:hypothetical protein
MNLIGKNEIKLKYFNDFNKNNILFLKNKKKILFLSKYYIMIFFIY